LDTSFWDFFWARYPFLFELFGIPLEVRHVTLAAASLGYALDASWIYGKLQWQDAAVAFSGIAVVAC